MVAALRAVQPEHGFALEVIDVDADPALEARYGELVPVLLLGDPADGVELCHYRLDAAAVTDVLALQQPWASRD